MALNAYLRIIAAVQGEIRGSVTLEGRENSILVNAVDHLVHRPINDNGGLAQRQHGPLVVTKEIDKASPLLFQALANGELLTNVTLDFWTVGDDGQEVQNYTIELTNALLSGIKTEMLNNRYPENVAHPVREKVSFTFQQIYWSWNLGGGIGASDSV